MQKQNLRRRVGNVTLLRLKAMLGLTWLFGSFRDHLGGDQKSGTRIFNFTSYNP